MTRIDELRAQYPTLLKFENGVEITLSNEEYEATLASWVAAEEESAAAEAERVATEEARESARLSARARLTSQGFTDAEIDVMYPTLAAPSAI